VKIKFIYYEDFLTYNLNRCMISQKQYDYVFKHLDFDKFKKSVYILFCEKQYKRFEKYHKTDFFLINIFNKNPEDYKWLKERWGKGVFVASCYYSDKQELKTIVNRVINIKLIRGGK